MCGKNHGVYGQIIGDIDKKFAEVEDILNRMFRTMHKKEQSDATQFHYYYGYQVTVPADGKRTVGGFGNIGHTGVRSPLDDTTIDEKENTLGITAEMLS